MQNLIKDSVSIDNDKWEKCNTADIHDFALLSLEVLAEKDISASDLNLGAFIQENETIEALLPLLGSLKVIAFDFGKFADGRAFSYARLLRNKHGFTGEIRACGDFMPDQARFLERCGFNSFACRTAEERDIALSINGIVSLTYQSDIQEKKPLFQRR